MIQSAANLTGPPSLCSGHVRHQRLRPIVHKLHYRVFSLLIPLDALNDLNGRLKLFSYNRFNLFSFHDRDFGVKDGISIEEHCLEIVRAAGYGSIVKRIVMLAYPRVLGYAFNPLTVYFCIGADDAPALILYEVSNTFGQRRTYILPVADAPGEVIRQSCAKEMYVSPFNDVSGQYQFTISTSAEKLFIGVQLKRDDQAIMNATTTLKPTPLSDGAIIKAWIRHPLLTLKIIGAIHWEALKLFFKRLKLRPRPAHPAFAAEIHIANAPKRNFPHDLADAGGNHPHDAIK